MEQKLRERIEQELRGGYAGNKGSEEQEFRERLEQELRERLEQELRDRLEQELREWLEQEAPILRNGSSTRGSASPASALLSVADLYILVRHTVG
jgi:hypothetical protein